MVASSTTQAAEKPDMQIVRATSKHAIFFEKKPEDAEEPAAQDSLDYKNTYSLKLALYETQRRSVRVLNIMQRALWKADGQFLDDYHAQHGSYPVGKDAKDKWPMPNVSLYQLARVSEPGLASGIAATLARQVFTKWGRERFESLILNKKSPPFFKERYPIFLREQDYFITQEGSVFVVHFSLTSGRHDGKEYKICIVPKDRFQKKMLEALVNGEWGTEVSCKRGDAKISRDHRRNWYIWFSYKRAVKKTSDMLCAGINRGIKNFLVLSADDGWKWVYGGEDIMEFLHRMQARRRSYQYCSKVSGRSGRGRKRLLTQATEHLRGKAANYRDTKNHTIASRLIADCVRRKIGFLYLENFTGIRDGEPSKLVGGKPIWDLIQEWPYYDLQSKIIAKALAPDHGFNSERSQRAENGGRP